MMDHRVRRVLALTFLIGLLALVAGTAHAQFELYDKFDDPILDPEKWSGSFVEGGMSRPTTEAMRFVDNGQLRLGLVSYGNDSSDSGVLFTRLSLNMKQLGTIGGTGFITGLKARITVLDAEAQDCPANPEIANPTQARVVVLAFLFNDGTGGGPTDATGNIGAFFQMKKDNDGVNRFVAHLFRCTVANCNSADTLVFPGSPVTFDSTWTPNTPVPVKVTWSQATHLVKFVVNVGTLEAEAKDIVYDGVLTDTEPLKSFDAKILRVQNGVENCSGDRKRAIMDAVFDKVMVRRNP